MCIFKAAATRQCFTILRSRLIAVTRRCADSHVQLAPAETLQWSRWNVTTYKCFGIRQSFDLEKSRCQHLLTTLLTLR